MMMMNNRKMHMVETWAENLKITTPEDYYAMCGLMKKRIYSDE
jgi:2-C-methyl-D-erythritol 4-phosphate cytidylyltransferase